MRTMMVRVSVRHGAAGAQRGQTLLLILLLLGIGFGAGIYAMISPVSHALQAERATSAALAQARDALIGHAARDATRPGRLPCPDTDNNGSAQLYAGSYCPSELGRLPWRTLGLADPRDGSGERLWYAVSRPYSRNPAGALPLNTDTPGPLTVTGTAPTGDLVAIVFAPGPVVGAQSRGAAGQNLAQNYLEGGNEIAGATSFTTAAASAGFNDRLLPVTRDALLAAVETRVAREARLVLRAFFSVNGYFPFANAYNDGTYRCTPGALSGRVPQYFSSDCKASATDPDWRGVTWPAWFFSENWHHTLFYAVSSRCAQPSMPGCAGGGNLLRVDGMAAPNDNLQALIITPGRALGSQARPCATVSDCLEGTENTNGDFVYARDGAGAGVNDRVVVVAP
jgi:hypothetical protein